MRYPLLGLTIAVTAMLGAWGWDAARPDALDAVRVGFAIALISCWCPMVLATWYAFRNADLRRMLHVSNADRSRRLRR